MLKANTGSSQNSNARTAGQEAAAKAGQGLDQVKMAFVYASSGYDLAELLAGVGSVWPETPLTGGTSCRGVLLPEGYVSGRHFVGILALADPGLTVTTGQARCDGRPAEAVEAGRLAARAALEKAGGKMPGYFHLTAMPGFEECYLRGVSEIIGRRPMSGLGVVDNEVMGDWAMFTEEGLGGYGLGVAFFYTDSPPVVHFSSAGYSAGDDVSVITEMRDPRTLVSLNHTPIIQHMAERSGFDPLYLTGIDLRVATASNPIGVVCGLGRLTVISYPLQANADSTIALGSDLFVGQAAIHMVTEPEALAEAAWRAVARLKSKATAPLGALHLAHSFGRGMIVNDSGLGPATRDKICQAVGDIPFIMPFTLSEMGFESDGPNTCGNLMLSYTGFPK